MKLREKLWPRSNSDVFVIDMKWLVVFHIVVIGLIVAIHWKLSGMHGF